MLQRTSLPTTTTSDLAESLHRRWEQGWLRPLQQWVRLPESWQQYMLLCILLAIVVAGMSFQIVLAVQIAESEYQVAALRNEYTRVERRNAELVYQLAMHSSLEAMQQLAAEQGFGPATGRTYIFRDQLPALTVAAPALRPAGSGQPPAGTPPGWLEQSRQWATGAQSSALEGFNQFMRDVVGRVQ